MKRIRCAEIGTRNCQLEVWASTVEDVVDEMLAHLRRDHERSIPEKPIVEGEIRIESEPERAMFVRLLKVAAAIDRAGLRSKPSGRSRGDPLRRTT